MLMITLNYVVLYNALKNKKQHNQLALQIAKYLHLMGDKFWDNWANERLYENIFELNFIYFN